MTTRRFATTPTKTPGLTGGDDRPQTPCAGNFFPWDLMLTHKKGTPQHEAARREAAADCARCPLTRCGYRIGRAAA